MRIALVVPCFNNFQGLAETLASVQTRHNWWPIIKDNWRENRGCSKAWNQGIKQAREQGADYILICNDDILFAPHTIDALVEEFNRMSKGNLGDVVMLSAVNVANACPTPESIFSFNRQPSNLNEHPDFSCFMVPYNFLDLVGEFDENFWPAYFEDNDMHRRIKLLGFKAMSTSGAAYYHIGSQTVNQDDSGLISANFEKNRGRFIKKWGGEPAAAAFETPFNNPVLTPKDWGDL